MLTGEVVLSTFVWVQIQYGYFVSLDQIDPNAKRGLVWLGLSRLPHAAASGEAVLDSQLAGILAARVTDTVMVGLSWSSG